jgi:WD40 repeat protein
MIDNSAITGMACDRKSQTLAVGNSNGYVIIFECDNQSEWKPIHNIKPKEEIPVTSLDVLNRSENLYIVGFANGEVKIISPKGQVLVEMSAHSRGINALTCHPSKPLFATCSDDTFLNIFEVKESLDIGLVLSSRVNDYQLVGVAFGGDSVISSPYDFKNLAVWNHVV